MPLGREVGLGPSDIVLDGDPAHPPEKGGRAPQFWAHVYCGQTAGRIKMPLATVVNLGRGDIVLDGVAAPPKRGTVPSPVFGPCLSWPNGWTDNDATWYGIRPRPRPHCVRRGPSGTRHWSDSESRPGKYYEKRDLRTIHWSAVWIDCLAASLLHNDD